MTIIENTCILGAVVTTDRDFLTGDYLILSKTNFPAELVGTVDLGLFSADRPTGWGSCVSLLPSFCSPKNSGKSSRKAFKHDWRLVAC